MRNFNYLLNFSKFLHTFYFFTFLPFYFFTFLLFYHFTFKNYGWHSNAHTLS